MFTRREVLKLGTSAVIGSAARSFGHKRNSAPVTESQKGDPEDAYEFVTYDPTVITEVVTRLPNKALFERWTRELPEAMITVGRTFVGCSRASTPSQISEFRSLFDLPIRDNNGYVAYCAAGLCFAGVTAYANVLDKLHRASSKLEQLKKLLPDVEHYYFYPTVSCVDMYYFAKAKRRWIDYVPKRNTYPKRGWVVLYDWNARGIPDHCGIVERSTATRMDTLEFNTTATINGNQRNGGAVAERTRSYDHVLGFVVTDIPPNK